MNNLTQASLGTTPETTNVMRLLRNRSRSETKDFMDDFTKHVKIVLDTLEGTQKVFWLIESDIVTQTVTVKFGATLGIGDLPPEVQRMVEKSEAELRAKEDGDGSGVVNVTLEGTIDPSKKGHLAETLKKIYDMHPEPRKEQIPRPPEEKKESP